MSEDVIPSNFADRIKAMMDGSLDDAAITRAQCVLTEKGIKLDADTVREVLAAAATPEPVVDEIPVSLGMVDAGRKLWLSQPSATVHVLLPALYRAMEQKRRDEEGRA